MLDRSRNGVSSVVMTGVLLRARRRYTGVPVDTAASVAFRASMASHGQITIMRGITRVIAMSSIA